MTKVVDALRRWAAHRAGTLPQAVGHLVHDAARRHGRVRVGAATAYAVVDDDALLSDALREKGKVALRRIAPGVAVSGAGVAATLEAVRALGLPAVVEGGAASAVEGGAASARSGPRRATAPLTRELVALPLEVPVAALAQWTRAMAGR